MQSDLGSKPSLVRPRMTLLIGLLLPSASWLLRPSSYLNVVERQNGAALSRWAAS
jgi:hypothetical protein